MATANNRSRHVDGGGGGARGGGAGEGALSKLACSRSCCGDLFGYLLRLRVSPEELEQRYKSREIDKFLEKDKHAFRRQVRSMREIPGIVIFSV